MNCRKMAEFLSDYVDGELDVSIRSLIEAHGGECPPCRAFVRTLARTVEIVRRQPREPLPPSLKQALVKALAQSR